MNESGSIRGHLAAAITILFWGTTFVSTKVLLRDFAPIEILFWRFIIGVVALAIIYPHRLRFSSWKEELLYAGAGLCGVTLYYLFENNAIDLTYPSNASVIISIAPLFTALIAGWILGGEKPRWYFYLGFVTAMLGVVLVSFNGTSGFKFAPAGDLLMLGAVVVWATYCNITRRISEFGRPTIQTTRRIFEYGLLFMIPALFLFDFHFGLERFARPVNLLNILFLGLGASALCYVTWNSALRILGTIKTSVYMYAGPVVTMLCSAIVLRDPLTWMLVCGAVLALTGLVISEQGRRLFSGRT